MKESRRFVLERLFTAIAVVLAAWVVATTINLARVGRAAIPQADDWDRWTTYFRDHYTWWWFWQQHVDHRLFAPRLLFAFDHLVFDGRGWFLVVCSFCIQAFTAYLLWRLATRAYTQEPSERWVLAAWIVAFLFCGQQWFNFILPFQVQFPMVYCSALAAFVALWYAAMWDWPISWVALTIIAAAVSTYSMVNGLLLWPVLLLAAYWLRAPRRPLIAIAVAALLLGPPYLYHFHRAIVIEHLPPSEKPLRVVTFFLAQLGAPLAPLGKSWTSEGARLAVAIIPGVIMLLALGAASVVLCRRRTKDNSARAMVMFYCVFLAATSLLVAYGRSQDTPFDAFMSKYLTPPYLLWAAMAMVAWPFLRRVPRMELFGAVCAVILLVIVIHQPAAMVAVRMQVTGVHLGEIAIADNVVDPDAWFWIFHPPETSQETIDQLRNNRLTLFTEEWTHWTGIQLDRRFSIDRNPDACQGSIEQSVFVPSTVKAGWRLTGWAWDRKGERSPRYIVFGDESGTVAGVALPGFPLPPALAALPAKYVASTWSGYVGGSPRPVTAYVLEADDRSLCPIGTVKLRSSGIDVPFTTAGPLFPVSTPDIVSGFSANGYYQGPGGPGGAPIDGPVFGSFPDANQGSMRLGPFHLDGHTEMVIPMVTGPDNLPLSILVRDAGNGQVLAKMAPPPKRVNWWAWHPDLPQDRELNVEIVAEDRGSAWGQWIAVAWPHVFKPAGQ